MNYVIIEVLPGVKYLLNLNEVARVQHNVADPKVPFMKIDFKDERFRPIEITGKEALCAWFEFETKYAAQNPATKK